VVALAAVEAGAAAALGVVPPGEAFEFCDVDLSRRCLAAGYQLASVPSIVSIAGGVIPDPERYKYVHDYR